jgi:hypothetical protein
MRLRSSPGDDWVTRTEYGRMSLPLNDGTVEAKAFREDPCLGAEVILLAG